ncbi:benzoate/H(+) symporter BenE family transporter [Leucobacter sp. GX24907]
MERSVNRTLRASLFTPIGAGVLCGVVGFTATFAVVLTGLRSVGASESQATSGLMAVTVCAGAASLFLSIRHRIPIVAAWSTPGAALLMSLEVPTGGWAAAVGAFITCGAMLAVTGLWSALAELVGRIPAPIAQAMLAGVLLPLVIAPIVALPSEPLVIAPVLLTWLIIGRWWPRWAVPAALVAAAAALISGAALPDSGITLPSVASFAPHPQLTTPAFEWSAILSIALPLYLVTMASQNVPGTAVLASFGYMTPWRPALLTTGIGSMLGAPLGGHAINLAAISAALAAGPDAGAHNRRWIAGATAGGTNLALGAISSALAALMLTAPAGLITAIAGVGLIGTLIAAITEAVATTSHREAAVVTFVVAASGIALWGVSSACWALLAGLTVHAVRRHRRLRVR